MVANIGLVIVGVFGILLIRMGNVPNVAMFTAIPNAQNVWNGRLMRIGMLIYQKLKSPSRKPQRQLVKIFQKRAILCWIE